MICGDSAIARVCDRECYTTCKYQKSVKMTTHFRLNKFMLQLRLIGGEGSNIEQRGSSCTTILSQNDERI